MEEFLKRFLDPFGEVV